MGKEQKIPSLPLTEARALLLSIGICAAGCAALAAGITAGAVHMENPAAVLCALALFASFAGACTAVGHGTGLPGGLLAAGGFAAVLALSGFAMWGEIGRNGLLLLLCALLGGVIAEAARGGPRKSRRSRQRR